MTAIAAIAGHKDRRPFPLQWPAGWTRTPPDERRRPNFESRLAAARDGLLNELRLLPGDMPVITTDLPVRVDGLPYANGRAQDPGVAVYWLQVVDAGTPSARWTERAMACDRWDSHGGNMRALAMSIGALRGLSRWGSSTIVDRAFAGFAALPSVASIDWRQELDTAGVTLDAAREAYRRRARELHPDRGGDPDAMIRLNQAWEAAQRELTP